MSDRRWRVVWAEGAVRDLEEIAEHIALTSAARAEGVLDRLTRKVGSLAVAPMRGHVVTELALFGIRTWRELVARPYRVFYRTTGRITGPVVYVAAVLDGRRDVEDLLLERLLREQ